jgi:hypothetical protein
MVEKKVENEQISFALNAIKLSLEADAFRSHGCVEKADMLEGESLKNGYLAGKIFVEIRNAFKTGKEKMPLFGIEMMSVRLH